MGDCTLPILSVCGQSSMRGLPTLRGPCVEDVGGADPVGLPARKNLLYLISYILCLSIIHHLKKLRDLLNGLFVHGMRGVKIFLGGCELVDQCLCIGCTGDAFYVIGDDTLFG